MRYLCQLANITDMDSAIMVGDRKFDVSGAHLSEWNVLVFSMAMAQKQNYHRLMLTGWFLQ